MLRPTKRTKKGRGRFLPPQYPQTELQQRCLDIVGREGKGEKRKKKKPYCICYWHTCSWKIIGRCRRTKWCILPLLLYYVQHFLVSKSVLKGAGRPCYVIWHKHINVMLLSKEFLYGLPKVFWRNYFWKIIKLCKICSLSIYAYRLLLLKEDDSKVSLWHQWEDKPEYWILHAIMARLSVLSNVMLKGLINNSVI